jgi:hypothetical protein
MFCWPSIIVYQYNETNVMHFSFNWETKASTCFEHYLLILRRRSTNSTLYIACVCQLAVPRLQWNCNRGNIPSAVREAPPEDEQVMLETCRGSWFSINWMKSASRWFHYTDTQVKYILRTRYRQIVTIHAWSWVTKKFQGGDAFESLSGLSATRHSILLYTTLN